MNGLSLITSTFVFMYFANQFLQSNTNLAIVQQSVSGDMTQFQRIYAIWSGSAGTLFVWFIMLVYLQFFSHYFSKHHDTDIPSAIISCFTFLILVGLLFERPFETLNQSNNQSYGLAPSLRSPYIAFHPLLSFGAYSLSLFLYAAFVSNVDYPEITLRKLHGMNYLIVGLMASAMVSGAFWSNDVLWGGHWTWDPVENLSLMIFLLSMLPIHLQAYSNKVQRSFLGLTFPGILFSNFVIRSGLLKDPHSYASSAQITFFLILFVISLIPYFQRFKIPQVFDFSVDFKNQGRSLWILFNIIIIIFIFISTLDLMLLSLIKDEKIASPKIMYHIIVLPMLLFPLIITIFSELREIGNISRNKVNLLFGVVFLLFIIAVLNINHNFSGQLLLLLVFTIAPLIIANMLMYQTRKSKITKRKTIRMFIHLTFLLLILGFSATNASTIYQDQTMKDNSGISKFGHEISVIEINYSSNLGEDVYPWELPTQLVWEIMVIISVDDQLYAIQSGWNPIHQYYTVATTINSLLTTLQIHLKYVGFAPFKIDESNNIILNLQIRKMFNGYALYFIEILFPIMCYIPAIIYLKDISKIQDYYN